MVDKQEQAVQCRMNTSLYTLMVWTSLNALVNGLVIAGPTTGTQDFEYR